jgi:HEAT repeat protein
MSKPMSFFRSFRIAFVLTVAVALIAGVRHVAVADDAGGPKADDPRLLLWLNAGNAASLRLDDGGRVSGWGNAAKVGGTFESREGLRPHFVEQALGGRPAVRFDGTNILRNTGFGRSTKRWTLMMVVTPRSNRGSGQFHGIFSANRRGTDDFVTGLNVDLGPVESTTFSELNFESAKDDPGARSLRTEASKFGEGQIITLVTDATHTQLYVGLEAENMRFAGDAECSLEEVRIGGRFCFGGERFFFDGDISEVLFYNTALGEAERVALTQYLSKKYGCDSRKIVYSLDGAWAKLNTYDGMDSRLALTPIDQAIRRSHGNAAERKEIERRLLDVLQSDAPAGAKEFAIRRLIHVGTEESVPALAKYLVDPHLGILAQVSLQAIPGDASAAAIRDAVAKAPPSRQIGLVQGLGLLRDRNAVPMLVKLLAASKGDVAIAAAQTLAQIGEPDCLAPLNDYLKKADSAAKPIAFAANLSLANRLLERDHAAESARVFHSLEPSADDAGRCAILAGLVKAEPDKAGSLLVKALADKSPRVRGEAAAIIRATQDKAIFAELTRNFAEISRNGQILLLRSIGDTRPELVEPLLTTARGSTDVEVRVAAMELGLKSLDRTISDIPAAVRLAAAAQTAAEKEAAFQRLTQVRGKDIDGALISELKQSDAAVRSVAIRALAARQCPAAFEEFVKATKDSDPAIRLEAGKAMQSLASEKLVGRLIELLLAASGEAEQSTFEQALIASCQKIADADKQSEPVLAEYARANERAKGLLLPVLGALGGKQSDELIHAAIADPKSPHYELGVRALANWPDATVVPELETLAKSDTNPAHRSWIVRGIARVAPRPGQLPPAEAFATMRQAFEWADRLEDKKLVLTRMGAVRTPDCLAFVVAKIDDAELQAEAVVTAAKLAEAMRDSHPREAKAAFERVLEVTKDDALRTRVQRFLGKIRQ